MKPWIVLALLAMAPAAAAQQSMEQKACLFAAGEKLPNLAGMAVTGHRFVATGAEARAKSAGSRPIAVEIDALFAGESATFLFVCAGQVGGAHVVFPQGIVK